MILSLVASAVIQQDQLIERPKSIESVLKATGLNYSVSKNGKNYQLIFDHKNNRKQTVFVTQDATKFGTMLSFSVYTNFWVGTTNDPSREFVEEILLDRKKYGHAYFRKNSADEKWSGWFGWNFIITEIPTELSAEDPKVKELKDTLYYINQVGEEMDLKFGGSLDH